MSLCRSHQQHLSLTLGGESDSKALNLALYCSAMNSFATASTSPLAILFPLGNPLSLAAYSVPFFPGQVVAVPFQTSTSLCLVYRN